MDKILDICIIEYPFWRDGMTPEEFEEERNYFVHHYKEFQEGKYVPLWKQKEQTDNN